jgi:hypothetical protein
MVSWRRRCENVYGSREVTLKSDRSFQFLVWLFCEGKNRETLEVERTSYIVTCLWSVMIEGFWIVDWIYSTFWYMTWRQFTFQYNTQ